MGHTLWAGRLLFDDDASVFAVMRAGARSYLLKGAEEEETIRALQVVSGG